MGLTDDKGAGMVLELNAVDGCREVKQEIRCCMLLVGRWVILERVGGGHNKWVCGKHEYLGQCDGVKTTLQDHPKGHLNIIDTLRATISCFIVEGYP